MKGQRILVTGGSGFIGSNLVRRLCKEGARVSITTKYKSAIDNIRLSSVWDELDDVVECDLRNLDAVLSLKDKAYDVVFHLAAYNHVGGSFVQVNESLASNAVGTANLLDHGPSFERFVYTATSEVYGLQDSVPFHETSSLPFPISPYAIGKYTGELYARMRRHMDGRDIICLRPFNTFGPYQSERAVIPELIIKCLRGLKVETTEGRQTREFNYVDNIVDGFIAAATGASYDGVVNLGCGEEIAIRDLVQRIHDATESSSELCIGALPTRPTEIWRMSADATRAQEALGWTPAVSFDDGLARTIEWYRRYLAVYSDAQSALNQL